jgi:hypothetical protein
MLIHRLAVALGMACAVGASSTLAQSPAEPAEANKRSNRPPLEPSVTDIGVYKIVTTEKGPRLTFAETSKDVQAEVGAAFGFTWTLKGHTGTRLVPVRLIVKHPPVNLPNGQISTGNEDQHYFPAFNGSMTRPFVFRFEHPYELVPGEWTLGVYYDDKRVAESTFNVIAPK